MILTPLFLVHLQVGELRQHMSQLVSQCAKYCQKGTKHVDHGRRFFSLWQMLSGPKWEGRMGPVAPLIASVGATLEELESCHEGLLCALETAFGEHLEEFIDKEVYAMAALRSAHRQCGDELEAALTHYLDGKAQGGLTRAELLVEVQKRRVAHELARFDLIGELNAQATKKRLQLCDRVCSAVYGFLGYHSTCHSTLAVLESGISELSQSASMARRLLSREELLRSGKRSQLERDLRRGGGALSPAPTPALTAACGDGTGTGTGADAGTDAAAATAAAAAAGVTTTTRSRSYSYTRRSLSVDNGTDERERDGDMSECVLGGGGDGDGSTPTSNHDGFFVTATPGGAGAGTEEASAGVGVGACTTRGFLWKKSTKQTWQRRWFHIRDGRMFYTREPKPEGVVGTTADLFRCVPPPRPPAPDATAETDGLPWLCNVDVEMAEMLISSVKALPEEESDRPFTFRVVCPRFRKYFLQAESTAERDMWVEAIEAEILRSLTGMSGEGCDGIGERERDRDDYSSFGVDSEGSSNKVRGAADAPCYGAAPLSSAQEASLRAVPGNALCADCGSASPGWASCNLGVLICIDCSGVHRSLGAHVTKVPL